jgi:acetyl esterase/lipase
MVLGPVVMAALFAALVGVIRAPARESEQPDKPAEDAGDFAVERHADLAYRTDARADRVRHTLDFYAPKGVADFPVMLFVHGGRWASGDKDLYAPLGEAFARAGIGVVVCNYRLSPAAKHPAHVEDVAKAFAWVRANAAKFGGNPERIVLCGHSAGAHLAALLATDPAHLAAEGHSPRDVRGVIAVSGVYLILPNVLFAGAFGTDPAVCEKASPLTHAGGRHPPFLLAYADADYPLLDAMAAMMHQALRDAGTESALVECAGRDHISVVTNFVNADDPLHRAAREFIAARCKR